MTDLPSGWVTAQLQQIASTQLGRMLSAGRETGQHSKPYLRNRDVQWGSINVEGLPVMDFDGTDRERFILREGDVLVCEGGEVGRAAIWKGGIGECYFQKALHRVRVAPGISNRFLRYLLEYYSLTNSFERFITGTTIAHLPQEDLRLLPVNVPPSAEQRRIVATIEEEFSRLDAGVAALERVQQNLKRMRAALLQEAVTPTPETSASSEGWRKRRIGDFATVTSGATPSRGRRDYWDGGVIPWITSTLVNQDTIKEAREFVTDVALKETSIKLMPAGTILVAMYGEGQTRGKCSELRIEATTNQACASVVLPPDCECSREYLKIFLNSSYEANRLLSAGGVQPNLSVGIIKDLLIDLPPPTVQERIVRKTWKQLEMIDVLRGAIAVMRSREERLRASILAAAFSGRLVSHDPNDESASILLERIADERSTSNGTKPIRTRKPRTKVTA